MSAAGLDHDRVVGLDIDAGCNNLMALEHPAMTVAANPGLGRHCACSGNGNQNGSCDSFEHLIFSVVRPQGAYRLREAVCPTDVYERRLKG